ncbi:S9 family peptidase [Flavobacterium cerinum]|uniref:Alpha/beta fold hydrolase n=1 Tax=Flavobacterium cerinum TaxID=2502784 RepID=A0ABY5IQU4_9FLAO|nr:alpha/beta fold hydrolase [Flavobacterium cerinum]UUC43922.1 alpha/beta fold hydrolase [Flavobacterium cerinum]
MNATRKNRLLLLNILFLFTGILTTPFIFGQNNNLVTIGIPDTINANPNAVLKAYNSTIDFPAFIDWDNNGILLNGGTVIYKMNRPNGSITEKYKMNQGLGDYLSPDHNSFLFLEDTNGDERYQLFLHSIKTGINTVITEIGTRSTTPFWKPDSRQILYKSNARTDRETDLYLRNINPPYNDTLLIQNITDEAVIYDWDVRTNRILFVKIISENNKELYRYDINTGELQQINSGKEIAHSNAMFLSDSDTILIVSDEGSEFQHLMLYNYKTGTSRKLTNEILWDIDAISMASKGHYLAFTVNENGYSALYRMNLTDFTYKRVATLPTGIIRNLKINRNGNAVAFNFYGSTFKRKVYTYDFEKDQLFQWTNKNGSKKTDFAFIQARSVSLPAYDPIINKNYSIPAFLYEPKTSGKHPVYIDIHGGPEYQALPFFNKWHQFLVNELGIAVIVPNIRGSNGYGKSYMKSDDGLSRENAVKDIGILLDWIATQPQFDKERIALFGESYGGYMVLAALANFPDKIRCGIDVVGISDFVTYLEKTADYRKELRRVEFGDERIPEIRDFLLRISPVTNVNRMNSPLFIVQGYNDPRVHYQVSEQMVQSLQEKGKTVWYLGAKDEGHGFQKSENNNYQKNAEILFLTTFLLPKTN